MTDHQFEMNRFDFRNIVERLPLVVYVDELDEHSSPLYISPQIERLLGYTPAEWLADPGLFISCIHPHDRENVLEQIATRNESGVSTPESDYRLIGRDGRVVWVRDDEIVVNGAAHGFLQDVTSHKQDEVRLELLVGILSLAADETPPDEIVAHAAEHLAKLFGDVHVSYVERRDEGGFYIRYMTDTGKPEFWDEVEWSAGYVERLEEGAPIVVEDVTTETWLDPIRDRLVERSVASFVDVPLLRHGKLQGVLWFNCARPRAWGEHELSVLVDVAGQLAVVLSNARAREQRLLAEQGLRRRDAVLEAVSHGAERLVAAACWRDAATGFLRELGEAFEASRAYLFEAQPGECELMLTQTHEWVADGVTAQIGNSRLQGFCPADTGFAHQVDLVLRNEVFAAKASELSGAALEVFDTQQIKSMLTVPIFVGDACWGVMGFEDCLTERDWSAAETDALRTATSIVAAAIERERSEVVLREHEQKLRAVFETALDAIFITDDDRRYVDVNPAACEYLGVAKDDLVGHRIDEFLPPHKLATIEEDQAAYLAGGPVLTEWESQRSDGTVRIAEASARPNFLPGLHIAFLRDVTERKQLEAELLNAQKLESLGRLAGGVAHDFNNLLTGITGYASLLLERANGDAELTHDLIEIKRAADRAAELTQQLLAFGRRQMFRPRPFDLNAALTEATGLLQRLLGDQIELIVRPGPALGVVLADPGQVEQVIVNLVVNARDALPAGGRVTIETRNADDGWVELVVADDGVGMDESTRSQVFEPFFTTREQGAGLGLASVYGIVHQSGGDVAVESDPGAGATFTVRLPRVAAAAESAPAPTTTPESLPGSETVLLVEDEDVVRDLARRVLERHGYTVFACARGAEAVKLSASHDGRIDLLLTDVVMPGMRGYEVARKVAATRPEIKILYMSGYAEEALVGEPEAGGSALIEKPFAIDALARRVREVLEP